MDLDAEIFLRNGPSFFYRHLPFWGAVWVERIIKILIPLFIVLLPIFTYLPALLNLSPKIKLALLYEALKSIERRVTHENRMLLLTELEILEKRVEDLRVSVFQTKELYDLRMHIAMVRDQLKQA